MKRIEAFKQEILSGLIPNDGIYFRSYYRSADISNSGPRVEAVWHKILGRLYCSCCPLEQLWGQLKRTDPIYIVLYFLGILAFKVVPTDTLVINQEQVNHIKVRRRLFVVGC